MDLWEFDFEDFGMQEVEQHIEDKKEFGLEGFGRREMEYHVVG